MLDEPFAALDALTRLKMQALVTDLWRVHSPAVLLVTHDVDEALMLADRALVLEHGKIALDVRVTMKRPRQPDFSEFGELRRLLLAALGVQG